MKFRTALKATAALVAGATLVVVLLITAGPAASGGRTEASVRGAAGGPVRLGPVSPAVTLAAASVIRGSDPRVETMSIDRLSRQARHRAWLARLHAWKSKQAQDRPERNAVVARYPSSGGSVRSMVISIFSRIAGPGQVPMALCIANRESSFNPYARNPHSSAAGVFQWVSRSWSGYSHRYGFAGASVFNAYANISVAAHAVADGGWGPWGGGC